MNANFYLCDICNTKVPTHLRILVSTGKRISSTGVPEDDEHGVDLCHLCTARVLKSLLSPAGGVPNYSLGKKVVELVNKGKKQHEEKT